MTLTIEMVQKAMEDAKNDTTRPIIVMPKVWMKWFARRLGEPYLDKKIDTTAISYHECQKIK